MNVHENAKPTPAIRWFAAQGVATERVMTDNRPGYRSRVFAAVPEEHGARHLRTRPYTPWTNRKAERFIRTAVEGWAYARPRGHSNARTAALSAFLRCFNCGRLHGGIGNRTPQQRLSDLTVNNVPAEHS